MSIRKPSAVRTMHGKGYQISLEGLESRNSLVGTDWLTEIVDHCVNIEHSSNITTDIKSIDSVYCLVTDKVSGQGSAMVTTMNSRIEAQSLSSSGIFLKILTLPGESPVANMVAYILNAGAKAINGDALPGDIWIYSDEQPVSYRCLFSCGTASNMTNGGIDDVRPIILLEFGKRKWALKPECEFRVPDIRGRIILPSGNAYGKERDPKTLILRGRMPDDMHFMYPHLAPDREFVEELALAASPANEKNFMKLKSTT
jgi:hypothetical protein